MSRKSKLVGFFLILIFSAVLMSSSVFATAVLSNTHIWQDKYLASVYAGHENATISTFENLADAQLKVKFIPKNERIILLESSTRPVVKNFRNVLNVNGYSDVESVQYDSYEELQEILLERLDDQGKVNGIAVLDPKFGVEAITIAPTLRSQGLVPLFLTKENSETIENEISSYNSNIFAGRFPVRDIERLDTKDAELIIGLSESNVKYITEQYLSTYSDIWGILMRPDMVDLPSLGKTAPIFLYTGSVEDTAELVKNSQMKNFEVIGGRLADTATVIEQQSGKDLRFLLKYGRTVTQVQGLEGQILDIDSEDFPFPFVNVNIGSVTYYEENGKLAVEFVNTGNVDALIFSNVEFGTQALTDNFTYAIPPNSKITIPYDVEPESASQITINTQYGHKFPLVQQVQADDGRPFVEKTISTAGSMPLSEMELSKAELDTREGILYVTVLNKESNPIKVQLQFPFNETLTLASLETELLANEKAQIEIPVPYLTDEELLDKQATFVGIQGNQQTIFVNSQIVGITEKAQFNAVLLIVVVLVILLIVAAGVFVAIKPKGSSGGYKRRKRR